jgi:hypothetical protein
VSTVRYDVMFYFPEDGILLSHRCEILKSCKSGNGLLFAILVNDPQHERTNWLNQVD